MRIPSLATCLVLAGCATSSSLDANNQSAQQASPAAASSSAGDSSKSGEAAPAVAVVREFEISEFAADDVECRREAPLGSRISVERCYSTVDGAETPAEAALDQIKRQEIENMRQQQMWQEQQRITREMAWRQRAMQQAR